MLGYVMDGNCAKAKTSIAKAVKKRADALCMREPCDLSPSKALPGYRDAFETRHHPDMRDFTIHHVLLPA